ncbi:MAG: molybdopterin molybdenumtransferase MoeA [Bacteroidetes bacterium]|nr:MAG: molybdopterin molybdenumtransferase MoeA [Bacteroidota bacterium]
MILIEQAYELVMRTAYTLDKEQVELNDSLNRILAQDVVSDIEMPPFNKSAMDGYACRREDINNELEVIEVIAAGKAPTKTINKNQCSKIMTGAEVPEGADCVIMVEHTEEIDSKKIRVIKENPNDNISLKAEDVKINDVVLKEGTKIGAQHIAVMASVGCVKPIVVKKPKVGIITTGNEIVEPNNKPQKSQIRNSNAYQLIAQINNMGAIPKYYGIARDDKEDTRKMIETSLSENDVTLLTGGVSMGDFDYVEDIFNEIGINILFNSLAVKPGKPTTFGVYENKRCFGLPGNPVSSFIQFEILAKPLLYSMMGFDFKPLNIKLPMSVDYNRRNTKRKSFIPIIITDDGEVMPVDYHGSAHIHSLSEAHGIISVPIGCPTLKKGEIIDVRQI